ncbi:Mu transposase C-terminal domain-containing protein [Rhodanobacter sp. MP7CTX1]|uniref:Mu transposase C-terminal domain-containing protein n=1 Tax=Rhodanobacter sp. MP7CTX1 TaxID=2723084 RepID=UPI00160DBFAA|nr:Mu transposase C-terminal domain-containing protein [Rhodanobacter sp. MP7CTX1]MBB6188014.1 putative transposase [Rhodanobacter sp. MP7CTX1]
MSNFQKGNDVIYQGLRMRVMDPAYNGAVTLMDLQDSSVLCRAPVGEVALAPHVPKPLAQIDLLKWNELESMANAARAIIKAPTLEERQKTYTSYALQLGCSKRTLQRVVKQIKRVDSVDALRGGVCGRPIGMRMLSPAVEEIIARQLAENWLVPNQPNLSDIIDQIQSECRTQGLRAPLDTTVRKRAAALDAYRTMALRKGAKKAKYTLKAMVGHIEAALALETVQIDHTLADLILVSEDNRAIPIGRPWITLAIDVATRMVVGVYITFEPPSAVSVAMCLLNALLPKEAFVASLGLTGRWPVFGVMRCIHLDNGRDFHSDALQRGCSNLGIDIQYRPVGSPHYGGMIERLIGTFMGRCRLLPGATQNNIVNRGDYDAEAKAVMTLTEFKAFLVNEIVNVYHTQEHRTLGVPPLVKWDELQSCQEEQRILPAGWEQWMLPTAFYPFEMRRVRRTGIQMFRRFYWAEGLEEWVGDGIERPVSYDPGDVSKVIIEGPNGIPLVAYDTRGDVNHLSLYERRNARKQQKLLGHDPELLAQQDAGLTKRQSLTKNATKDTKKEHRQAAIARGQKQRSADVPASSDAQKPAPAVSVPLFNFDTPVNQLNVRRKGS